MSLPEKMSRRKGERDKESVGGEDTYRAEEGIEHGDIVSPLAFQGRKGGNPLSPEADNLIGPNGEELEPRDPLGLLSTITGGATKRGKKGPGY